MERGGVVVFVNTMTKAIHLTTKLEKKCDEVSYSVDIPSLNGSLNKHDKIWRIRFFVIRPGRKAISISGALFLPTVPILAFCFQLARDLPTFFQESGWGSTQRGKRLATHLFVDLASFVNLRRKILGSDVSEDDALLGEDAEALQQKYVQKGQKGGSVVLSM